MINDYGNESFVSCEIAPPHSTAISVPFRSLGLAKYEDEYEPDSKSFLLNPT